MPIQRALSGGQAIALGTAIAGCADAIDAMLFFGLRYGVPAGRIFQTMVVLPLSAFGRVPQFSKLSLANGLLIHAFGVGLPSALVVSRTAR